MAEGLDMFRLGDIFPGGKMITSGILSFTKSHNSSNNICEVGSWKGNTSPLERYTG
jgi:hypothetical protein